MLHSKIPRRKFSHNNNAQRALRRRIWNLFSWGRRRTRARPDARLLAVESVAARVLAVESVAACLLAVESVAACLLAVESVAARVLAVGGDDNEPAECLLSLE